LKRFLVVSDLDGTLLGDYAALRTFRDWFAQQGHLMQIAYSSGRSFASILQSMEAYRLPTPVAVIGEVGTVIRRFPCGTQLQEWPINAQITSPRWSASLVREALGEFVSQADKRSQTDYKIEIEIELQPDEFQSEFKVSYFLHSAENGTLDHIRNRLNEWNLDAEIIYSSDRDLDILPAGVSKGAAALHLANQLGFGSDLLIACGDSGNDASMFATGCRSVIVANAQRELKSLSGAHIYHASSSFAAGVREGLEFWLSNATR
jgi:mannosylfructose-6-phosphate phosphatase